jgi:hypothetical protein
MSYWTILNHTKSRNSWITPGYQESNSDHCLSLYTHCAVAYEGRAALRRSEPDMSGPCDRDRTVRAER